VYHIDNARISLAWRITRLPRGGERFDRTNRRRAGDNGRRACGSTAVSTSSPGYRSALVGATLPRHRARACSKRRTCRRPGVIRIAPTSRARASKVWRTDGALLDPQSVIRYGVLYGRAKPNSGLRRKASSGEHIPIASDPGYFVGGPMRGDTIEESAPLSRLVWTQRKRAARITLVAVKSIPSTE
jgi:hypothetical protein